MQTPTSKPGEQDLGQRIGTDNDLRLFFLSEVLPQDLIFQKPEAPCPPRKVPCLAYGGTVGKSLENPWVGRTQRTALSFRALVSAPPGGVWLVAPVCNKVTGCTEFLVRQPWRG